MSAGPIRDRGFHVFVYGTLRADAAAAELLAGCRRLGTASVSGTLYDIDGEYPALMLYGTTPVTGEVVHIPDAARLPRLDEYEGVDQGLFRRVGVEVDGVACWTWVAGPALAHRLTPERRLADGAWGGGHA
jgi:gamma-glutamylcyclotransferase (GGCT)/AIG2-like uncharacterized protein YtfP